MKQTLRTLICFALVFGGWVHSPSLAGAADPRAALADRLSLAIDTEHGLKADHVAERSASTSPDVGAKKAELAAASQDLERAWANYLPRVQVQTKLTRLSEVEAQAPFQSLQNARSGQLSITVPVSDYALRLTSTYAAASEQEKAAALQARATELTVKSDARIAYYEWARSHLQVIVADRSLEQSNQHWADAKSAFEAGVASQADVSRVEAQVAASEQVQVEATNLSRIFDERIRTLMHEKEAVAHKLGENLLADVAPPAESLADLEGLMREALARRLEPKVIEANASAIRESGKASRAGYFPKMNAYAELTYANPNARYFPQEDEFNTTWSTGLEMTWVPSTFVAVAAEIAATEARAESLDRQGLQLADAIRLEIVEARTAIETARSAVATRARRLSAAEEAYRVRRELFLNGRSTSVELTDAETELTRAGLDAVDAHIDLHVALVRFDHATGRDVGRFEAES
jgi:outer membrane protein